MKSKIITTFIMLITTSFFVACSSDNNKDTEIVETESIAEVKKDTVIDIVLNAGGSATCTNKTSFIIIPSDNPVVTFSTNTSSGDTTIVLDNSTDGFVTITNCSIRN